LAKIEKSALVPFSAQAMFELVNDVESYPQFLPWCHTAKLLSHTKREMCGEIQIVRAGIKQTFSTCNLLSPFERIDLRLREGPFKRLDGTWRFDQLRSDACKVSLRMEFEFSGRLINVAFGKVFSQIADSLVDAFCKRARDLYSD